MINRAFLVHAFRIVPFKRWPVLIWNLIIAMDWAASMRAEGQPVPSFLVSRDGVVYLAEYGGPGADHWLHRLHARDMARCADAVGEHLTAEHGREQVAYRASRLAAEPYGPDAVGCAVLAALRLMLWEAARAGVAFADDSRLAVCPGAARAELPLPQP